MEKLLVLVSFFLNFLAYDFLQLILLTGLRILLVRRVNSGGHDVIRSNGIGV